MLRPHQKQTGLVITLLAFGSLALLLTWGASRSVPGSLMMDGGLEANSIDIDHNAMLASNPKKNAAFLRVFGNYVGGGKSSTLKTAPKGATQLSESTSGGSKGSGSDENSKLAQQMQAELTAGSEDEESYTPHFVAALNEASQGQMLASAPPSKQASINKEAMEALSMASPAAATTHVLPATLRHKFQWTEDKSQLTSKNALTPNQAALTASVPTQSLASAAPADPAASLSSASKADDALLATAPENISTKELIEQAAMRQMAVLRAKAILAAPRPQLAAAPARTQQMYNTGFTAVPTYRQAPPQQPGYYAAATPQAYSPYPQYPQEQLSYAPQPAVQYAPARLAGYEPPAARAPAYASPVYAAPAVQQYTYEVARPVYAYNAAPQAPAESFPKPFRASEPAMTAQEVGLAAANAAAPDWRSPDAIGKGKGGKSNKMAEMLALKSSIMDDFKKNTAAASQQLLMGV